MKLIIDIPEEVYNEAKASGLPCMYDELVASAVGEGTPLPKVIADIETEIEHMASRQYEYKLTLDRQEVLEVLDRYITEAEGGKDCKVCIHSEETDGSSCYECVKGIQDSFEADKGEE